MERGDPSSWSSNRRTTRSTPGDGPAAVAGAAAPRAGGCGGGVTCPGHCPPHAIAGKKMGQRIRRGVTGVHRHLRRGHLPATRGRRRGPRGRRRGSAPAVGTRSAATGWSPRRQPAQASHQSSRISLASVIRICIEFGPHSGRGVLGIIETTPSRRVIRWLAPTEGVMWATQSPGRQAVSGWSLYEDPRRYTELMARPGTMETWGAGPSGRGSGVDKPPPPPPLTSQ